MRHSSLISGIGALLLTVFLSSCGSSDVKVSDPGSNGTLDPAAGESSDIYAAKLFRPLGTEKCWVSPDPVADGERFTVFGSGFRPGKNITIFVTNGSILMTASDAAGNFSAWDWAKFLYPATVTPTAYYQTDDRHRYPMKCSSFQVTGTPR